MFCFVMQYGGISLIGNIFFWENGSNRLVFGFQGVGLIGPGIGSNYIFVFEIVYLYGSVMLVVMD